MLDGLPYVSFAPTATSNVEASFYQSQCPSLALQCARYCHEIHIYPPHQASSQTTRLRSHRNSKSSCPAHLQDGTRLLSLGSTVASSNLN